MTEKPFSSRGSADTVGLSLEAGPGKVPMFLGLRDLLLPRDPEVLGSSGPRPSPPPPLQDCGGRVFGAGEALFGPRGKNKHLL